MAEARTEDAMTVQAFAEKYRVDASVVRSWVRNGHIDWVLVGPRKMRRIRESDAIRPLAHRSVRGRFIDFMVTGQGMDRSDAVAMADSMDNEGMSGMLGDETNG